MNMKMFELDDYIGQKFFCRDGTDEHPLEIVTLKGYKSNTNGKSSLPIIEKEDGIEYICFSMLIPYSDELEEVLVKMDSEKQWNFLVKIKHFITQNSLKYSGKYND